MKKRIYTFIGLLIVLTISSAAAVHAQSATTAKAHIPFDFNVRNQTVAAGDCVIKLQNNRGTVSLIQGENNRQLVILANNIAPKQSFSNGKMTFRRYGDKYFLAGVETSDYRIELRKSGAERRLERELKNSRLAKNNLIKPPAEIVVTKSVM